MDVTEHRRNRRRPTDAEPEPHRLGQGSNEMNRAFIDCFGMNLSSTLIARGSRPLGDEQL